jgi:uncharacterized protein YndB with AHSA1/START domain
MAGRATLLGCVTVADRETHEKMGFHQGWARCIDQLEELLSKA